MRQSMKCIAAMSALSLLPSDAPLVFNDLLSEKKKSKTDRSKQKASRKANVKRKRNRK